MPTTPSKPANSANRPPALTPRARDSSRGPARRAIGACTVLLGVTALAVAALGLAALGPLVPRIGLSTGIRETAGTAARVKYLAAQLALASGAVAGNATAVSAFAQDQEGGNADKGASPEQVEKYVAVYRAMQHNHSMTVEQAAATQGMTVSAFRDLEQRISNDERLRDAARRALAAPAPSPTPVVPKPKARR